MTDLPDNSDEKKSPASKKEEFEFPVLQSVEEAPSDTPVDTPSLSAEAEANQIKKSFLTKFKPQFDRLYHFLKEWFAAHKTAGLAIGFVVVAGLMWGISHIRQKEKVDDTPTSAAPDEIPVNVIEVRSGRFQDTINAVGTLKGEAEIELRFEVDGTIQEFGVTEGGKVAKGQVIGRLNDRDANLKVRRAQNELEQMEKLYAIGGVSKTKLDESRLNMDVAQSEVAKTKIVATRDGILGDKAADVGEFVTPQRKIGTLVVIKNVVVEVGIIEKQVDKVYPGQKILVTVDAYPGNIFEGTIATISPIIEGDRKTFSIRAKIPNPDSLLLPGMFARSKIITHEVDDAMTVPNDALNKTPGGFQIFVVNKDNIANPVDVEVGYVSTELAQIQSGLNAGDIVVVQKPPELKAGSKVKIIEVQK